MNKEIKEFCNKVWNEEARRQLEAELNFMSKEKIELPKGKDYLELFAKTHKTDEEIMEEKDKEIDRLNNIINKTRRILGQYAHYSTPTEEQNAKNEAIVDEAYIQLHSNVAKELKENK